VAEYVGLRVPFFAYAFLSVLAALWVCLRIPETRLVLERQAKPTSDGNPTSSISVAGLKTLLRNPKLHHNFYCELWPFFTRTGSRSQILLLLASDRLGLSPSHIGLAMTIISVFNFISLFACGKLSDSFGRKILITP